MKTALIFSAALALATGFAPGALAQGQYTVLHHFGGGDSDGLQPYAGLVTDGSRLYGTTVYGGPGACTNPYGDGCGTVFALDTDGGGFELLRSFTHINFDGKRPNGDLLLSGSTLYGTTREGGVHVGSGGTLFRIGTDGSGYQRLKSFGLGLDGKSPMGRLALSGGMLFGTTLQGGTNGVGTVYRFDPTTMAYGVLKSIVPPAEGIGPWGGVAMHGGSVCGTALQGGIAYPGGCVFSLSPSDPAGSYTILHSFTGSPLDGELATGTVVSDGDRIYGQTARGGSGLCDDGCGIIYSLDPVDPAASYTILHNFQGPPDGGRGGGSTLALHDGTLYGTAGGGSGPGDNGSGILYRIDTDGTDFALLHDFQGEPGDGRAPYGGLLYSDDVLYGTTIYGGADDGGTVFSYDLSNYVNLRVSPSTVAPGGRVTLSWDCDFGIWDYRGAAVNIYLCVIRNPAVTAVPSSVTEALSGGTVYFYEPGMAGVHTGSPGAPTWSNVAFPPARTNGSIAITVPNSPSLAGDWAFATAFVRSGGGGFVRTDAMPVENSSVFSIQ